MLVPGFGVLSSKSMFTPSILNCTPAMPEVVWLEKEGSEAVAERGTVPETLALARGAVRVTVGGVVSGAVPPDRVKVAVTDLALVMETVQVSDAPEQAPPQEVKVEPWEGAAVRVTEAPLEIPDCEQLEPQLMEPPVTVPWPAPCLVTERA